MKITRLLFVVGSLSLASSAFAQTTLLPSSSTSRARDHGTNQGAAWRAVPSAVVIRGPYLQQNHATGITLRWRTDQPTDSVVWTGTTQGALTIAGSNGSVTTEHEVALSGLPADTKYFYAVGSTPDGMLAGNDANHFLRTAPVPGANRPMHIWVLGDCGRADARPMAVRDAYYQSSSYAFNDMLLLLGDNAYDTGTDAEYQNAIFNMYPTVLRQTPVWSCLGNHDTAQATGGSYPGAAYFNIFTFPTAAQSGGVASGTERYFSWEFGNVHFISLDTQTTDTTLRGNMLGWLDSDLAANTQPWTIAVWHHPAYTKGSHNSDTEEQLIWARENVVPRLEAAGVDLVLSGHSHSYERSKFIDGFYATPTLAGSGTFKDSGPGQDAGAYRKNSGPHNGAVYAVPGSAGQISGGSLNHPVMFSSINELGSLVLDLAGERLDGKFINSFGVTRDYFRIEKDAVSLVGIVSRKTHGGAGNFDIAASSIECRSGGANGSYQLVFSFASTLASVGGASVTSGTGSVANSGIDGGDAHNYIVNLTGVSNAQRVTVTLANVADSAGGNSSAVPITLNVLVGDTNASGGVTASDVSQTKAASGQTVTAANVRLDVNASGNSINASDVSIVKAAAGTFLP